ncbi:transmembrane amino acid transporter protein-domain-containing protein [Mycena floridula]|nr:transmembrane amino acid transporter protein-domain-containing protein [Mycena floridula]
MVQTYGVAQSNNLEPESATGEETSALLGGSRNVTKREGNASLVSSVSNLANTIIGSGMLTFPLAMASAGIIPGIITCLLSGSIAAFGLYILSLCAAKTPHRASSFFAVAQLTFPKAAVFFDAAIATKCFGVSISYLIILKRLMPNVVASLYHDLTSPSTNPPAWALSERIWLCIFMAFLVPLAFLRRIHSLRHTSYVALVSVAYLVVIVIKCYFWPIENMPAPGEIRFIHFTSGFVGTIPVQVFGFTCAQNLFAIYNELKTNNQERMNVVIGTSIGSATLIYEVIAVFGYLTFGSKVGANIIEMYPSTSLFIAIGQLVIVVLVMFSYPLQVHPCRNCLDKVFHAGQPVKPIEAGGDDEIEDADHVVVDMSPLKHTLITSAIIASSFTIAYFVSDLQLVLSFVGATGSTTISFILPGLFYWKLSRDDPTTRSLNKAAFALMLYGMCIFVFCMTYNIYRVINPDVGGPAH